MRRRHRPARRPQRQGTPVVEEGHAAGHRCAAVGHIHEMSVAHRHGTGSTRTPVRRLMEIHHIAVESHGAACDVHRMPVAERQGAVP